MDPVVVALAAAALLIGLTGTWSPCGFSMISTLGPSGHTGGRRTTLSACASFLPGALLGGVVTFGVLAVLGSALGGPGGRLAYLVAAGIAVVAAIAELRGAPIVPQLRRQLPEHWRRVMPMPLAAGLYGILLGLGFTTFVLSFGVWALAGIAVAVGELEAGVAIGVAFGIGRALPIVVLAPIADRPAGIRAVELMATRPAIYRGFRFGDGLALLVAAVALTAGATADAAKTVAQRGADPSVSAAALVYEKPGRGAVISVDGAIEDLPGSDPALGGAYVAVAGANRIRLLDRGTLAEVGRVSARRVDAVAVSDSWVAYRRREGGRDSIFAVPIAEAGNAGAAAVKPSGKRRRIASVRRPAQLSRPSLDDSQLVFAVSKPHGNKIVRRHLAAGGGGAILRDRRAALQNPSILGKRLLYVRIEREHQTLRLRDLSGAEKGRVLLKRKRGRGTLWSTALASNRAYVTLLKGTRGQRPQLLSVAR